MAVSGVLVVYTLLIASSVYFVGAASNAGETCQLNLNGDLPKRNQPIILTKQNKSYALLIPKAQGNKGFVELEKGDNIKLVCPGDKNRLRDTKTTSVDTKCQKDKEFTSNANNNAGSFAIKDALCDLPPKPDVKDTKTRCSQTGKLYEIGFQAEGWHPLISVCHLVDSADTLYTKHLAIGAALKGAERESFRPKFETGSLNELYKGFDPNSYYVQKAQDRNLAWVFKKYSSGNDSYLSRGHLAPDGDFLFASWQFATYLYINAAPQWQKINGGNWLTVEKFVRKLAIKLNTDLEVITGTSGVLELPDDKGKLQKIHLNGNKIRVPEYFWKLVYDPQTSSGIGIITSNNPYLEKTATLKICKNICYENNWLNHNATIEFKDPSQGLTICCTVNELRKAIPEVPFVNVQAILRGPN
ncbi:uncharacterized protein LOC135840304 [Planococcus citri]|uniref:uncharacterized protein LOC135840304 n=1 Tax=Planococcus citri TaxID=170843 RepID=UPI0031F91201